MSTDLQPLVVLAGTSKFGTESEGWTLHSPGGEELRSFRATVLFGTSFTTAPVVQVGLVGFDIANTDTSRVEVTAQNITPSSFDLVVSTWLGTSVYAATLSWLAIGT